MLTEGAIYHIDDRTLLATFMVNRWTLLIVDANGDFGTRQPGDIVGYRLVDGQWIEMIVDPGDTAQLVYGSVAGIDLAQLEAAAAADDEAFAELMAEIEWEWQ